MLPPSSWLRSQGLVQSLDRVAEAVAGSNDPLSASSYSSSSLLRLFRFGLMSRVLVTLLMALSCRLGKSIVPWMGLPPPPGDDSVVQFNVVRASSNSGNNASVAFALPATFCDCGSHCRWGDINTTPQDTRECRNALQSTVYPFLLEPLTRWDAARFLRLALQPQLRLPKWEQQPQQRNGDDDNDVERLRRLFEESEMAHAFFPLFPFVVQQVALVLRTIIPNVLLPCTCEGVLVLAAWLGNTIFVLWATHSLYGLTYNHLLLKRGYSAHVCRHEAARVALLFVVWNPASVFFCASYSESLFAALVFAGAKWISSSSTVSGQRQLLRQHRQFALGVLCWMAATYCRSNGILYAGYLLLEGMGRALQPNIAVLHRLGRLLFYAFATFLVVWPIVVHNQQGIDAHCSSSHPTKPEWCPQAKSMPSFYLSFYLYPYVQQKYWNVGFLRYFEWKQAPNFILSAPILAISSWATVSWISSRWKRQQNEVRKTGGSSKGTVVPVKRVLVWPLHVLQQAASDARGSAAGNDQGGDDVALYSLAPDLLAHYAVLAAAALLTFTTAHVQISTRLICSACPALYWFLASVLRPTTRSAESISQKSKENNNDCNPKYHHVWGEAILGYCVLYIVLGIVMHPNWLPWT